MRIVGAYSFNKGKEYIEEHYAHLYPEVELAVSRVDGAKHLNKSSKEKTMFGRTLYSPTGMNTAYKREFGALNWQTNIRIKCDYPTEYYVDGYEAPDIIGRGAYRELDFLKDRLGVEVQFGKYAFMVYNVCAKMTIFSNEGIIDAGIEIVPVKELAYQMSSGVSYFEQFVWDLEQRGISDIDIPVLILGITI